MGLDIYLYKSEEVSAREFIPTRYAANELEEKAYELMDERWNGEENDYRGRNALTESIHKELMAAQNIPSYPETVVQRNSGINPEHLFKMGYFRSSYNNSGFNSVMADMGLPTLYDIFNHTEEEYLFVPDWEASLERCRSAIQQLDDYMNSEAGKYIVHKVNVFTELNEEISDQECIKMAMESVENDRNMDDDDWSKGSWWSGREKMSFAQGVKGKLVMAVTSKPRYSFNPSVDVKLVFRHEGPALDPFYMESLKIVEETILYVLQSGEKEKYFFHWSG